MTKIGRNDPCPCGSGKKYKQCCMHKSQPTRAALPDWDDQFSQVHRVARQLIPQLPTDKARDLQHRLDQAEEALAYNAMSGQIEAASHILEAHRAKFKKMMADPGAAMERALSLFAEERFAALHYTAQDVHRAFEEVGFPSRFGQASDEKDMDIIMDAGLYLAGGKDNRGRLARRLMLALPEYVAAGRYLDGWLIQYSAYRLIEVPQESNPFLFAIFMLAFEAWTRQLDGEEAALLDTLGLKASALDGRDAEEAEALLRAQFADPAKKAALESYYDAHPMLYTVTQAGMWEMENASLHLFERDDADCLFLPQADVEPWAHVLLERLKPLEARARAATKRRKWDDKETLDGMSNAMAEVSREMAPAIFTPERIRRLVADLKAYQRELSKKQEEEAAMLARAAWLPLDRDDVAAVDPAETPLLVAICFASLREMMIAMFEARRGRDSSPHSE